jgi:hypothetical protein
MRLFHIYLQFDDTYTLIVYSKFSKKFAQLKYRSGILITKLSKRYTQGYSLITR